MNLRTAMILLAALMLLGLAAGLGCSQPDGIPTIQANVSGFGGQPLGDTDGSLMQDDSEDPGDDEGSEGEETEPSEEEPSEEEQVSMGDIIVEGSAPVGDENLQNALSGIKDYEVTYDTTESHRDNTPPAMRDLDVYYAGPESAVAQRTEALNSLDLLDALSDRYEMVEDEFAADPETDYDPDDPDRTLNYYEPRGDPFVIPELIPDELRPELEGTGLDGAVDPELLEQLHWAEYEANLRLIPVIVVGTIEAGSNRGCIYTIAGMGFTRWIEEGDRPHCWWWGAPFSLSCTQVSEDFVVLTLRGTYDYGCRYAATNPVARTFHICR